MLVASRDSFTSSFKSRLRISNRIFFYLFTHISLWILIILILMSYSFCSPNSRSLNVGFHGCTGPSCVVCLPRVCVKSQTHVTARWFLLLPLPVYPGMDVPLLPAAPCSGSEVQGQAWQSVVSPSGGGTCSVLLVFPRAAPGSVWPVKPKCQHLLPLSWSKKRRTEGLTANLLPQNPERSPLSSPAPSALVFPSSQSL